MLAKEKLFLFLAGWFLLIGAFWLNSFLVNVTEFVYWPTLFLVVYLTFLCFTFKKPNLFLLTLWFLILPLSLVVDTLSGSPTFGYYATGLLLGSLFFLFSLSFTNINNRSTQLINVSVFLIFFWIIGPLIFIKLLEPTIVGYNFLGAAIHCLIDFITCFFATKLVKTSSLKYV
jgi:hypothetical protein